MMADADKALLRLVRVTKSYGATQVLQPVDMAIGDGEFITVVGPSGSGKTTVLRLIGGFTAPSSGQILLDGADIATLPPYRRPFNTVFQDYALFPHLTVAENIGYGLTTRRQARVETKARVAWGLERVALSGFGARYPAQLSGGQRQRVALARAIVCSPRLVLLDEPLGALDAGLRRQMQGFLKKLQQDLRTTFLFVTHDQEEAITMADRIVVMDNGRIVQSGSPHDIYYRPASEYVARFFGDNNMIECLVRGTQAGMLLLDTPFGLAHAPCGEAAPRDGAAGWLVVRPEAIRLDAATASGGQATVRIEEITFAGPTTELRAAAGSARLSIKLASRAAGHGLMQGEDCAIGWDFSDGCFVPGPRCP